MNKYTLEVNTKEDGKYVPVGSIDILYPTLAELGLDIQPIPQTEKEIAEGEVIEYKDEKHQFVFESIFAAVKANVRNKLVSKSAVLKDGVSLPETVEELIATAERDGSALRAYREMLAAFKAWLPSTGKATKTQAAILTLASNKKSLALQSVDKKTKFLDYLAGFAGTLTPEQAADYTRSLKSLEEACNAVDDLDDM